MQLMALNALLLFDAIFIFFLFLVSVSCLLYYLPLVPPTRSSSLVNFTEAEMEADIESALDTSSTPCAGLQSHSHYRHRNDHESDQESFEQESFDQERDDQEIENDPCPTPTPVSTPHHHFSHQNPQNQSQTPDHPATHIIMSPPQRKYYQSSRRDKGQPFAPVETV